MKRLFIAGVALIALQSCIGTKHASAAGGVEGCYKVISQALSPNSKLRVEADMRLVTNTTWTPWGTFPKALEGTPDGNFKFTGGYWAFEKGELKIVWSNNGLSGFEIITQHKGERLEGVAQEFWDFEPHITNTKKMFLIPMKCGSSQ
jgi:hypothetical protein